MPNTQVKGCYITKIRGKKKNISSSVKEARKRSKLEAVHECGPRRTSGPLVVATSSKLSHMRLLGAEMIGFLQGRKTFILTAVHTDLYGSETAAAAAAAQLIDENRPSL